MALSSDVLNICQSNFTSHIILRCRLGLTPTHINDIYLESGQEVYDFVQTILLSSFRSSTIIKKQILAVLLYSRDERKRQLAFKILSLNYNDFNVFLLISHALFFMDITNMEKEGLFYDYLTGLIKHIFDNTEMKNLLYDSHEITSCRRYHMSTYLRDFSHFLSLFIN